MYLLCLVLILLFSALALVLERRLRSFQRTVSHALDQVPVPFALAARQGLYSIYQRLAESLVELAKQPDPLLQEFALQRLTALADELEELAGGTAVFTGTETWRATYQQLLLTLNVRSYLSVAWVRSIDYWNDIPGQRSLQMNYDLVQQGFHIQRIHILPDQLWPFEDSRPAPEIRPWLEEQHERGIIVRLVREMDLAQEAELACDFGIYGDRATAVQELDEQSRTVRYVLSFNPQSIRKALDRWERLSLYAISWESIPDRNGEFE